MKILVICQYYKPEPFRVSDICEELVKRGHEVHVVTGVPNYPMGEIYDGYRNKNSLEIINGVTVHRCKTMPRKRGALHRLLNYYSYALSSSRFVKSKECRPDDNSQFDVVLLNQLSPVMMGYAALAYKKKYNVPIVTYCLDLWPASLEAGGMKANSLLYRYFSKVSKKIYEGSDLIAITSKSFKNYLVEELDIHTEIKYLPQYAETMFSDVDLSKKPNGRFDFGFAGVVGASQSVETIVKTAQLLKDRQDIHFHIAGDGISLNICKKMAAGLNNITFYGKLPLKEMPEFYKKMDAMLVTLIDNDLLSKTMPGKVQSYMAAGKPIIGAIKGETPLVINQAECGICCEPEKPEELKAVIEKYIATNSKEQFGKNAARYYIENFSKEIFINKLEVILKQYECLSS
ncbi:MAG: glycosyltransferase family 4 protein [Acetatifactor sp.]|nr:glycosyltransferase family 4 protein [Acetatifactor sp.]